MAGMDNKNNAYGRQMANYGNNNMYGNQYGARGQTYAGMHQSNTADLATLAHGFQGMNIQNQSFAAQAKHAVATSGAANYGNIPVASMPNAYYGAPGHYGYANPYTTAPTAPTAHSQTMYTPQASQYMTQMSYQGYQQPHDNSPLSSQNWTPTTGTGAELPTLITPRRDSISSNENDQPATPSYASYPSFAQNGVAINRSPSGVFTHSTPSPTSMMGAYGMSVPTKLPDLGDVSPGIKLLLASEPAIPRAIPAPSSPLKPLDRALENQRGETNVYIRGLLPETTDQMLENWGQRFGDIKSSKSIIDMNTGLCKGFGFVKYHNYEDAENCIRGFHYLGYEVSFARESFYSKLKTFSDELNTNLYVSNLPKSMNEHELANLFAPHTVCSSRILRDKNGHGRGVGFARFDSRESCEEVIRTFNNHPIKCSDEDLQIQIRYADTQEQKSLKQQTQAARQFRSAEYEYATQAWRQGRLPYAGTTLHHTPTGNEFDQYLGTTPNVPFQGQRWAQSVIKQVPARSPLSASAQYTTAATGGIESEANADDDAAADNKPSTTSAAGGVAVTNTAESAAVAEHE
ncbi:hypothetical protein LTR62_006009 [Meristemomyces frigidus]|uniref:RRM domain-containing protein n=1 Tax=Meristemomyces frigidus TaxID=1508187 RepID=A0AAN7TW46_9PEZI|nr:hypothetical protein LTR62_006009 [Meristemomyces frigidus]